MGCDEMKAFPFLYEEPSENEKLRSAIAYQPKSSVISKECPLRPVEIRRIVRELRHNRENSCLTPVMLGAICVN